MISPLLANLYLHLLDRIWERHGLERPLAVVQAVLGRLDLSLNEAKSRVLDAREERFNFLGFSFELRRGRKSGRRYPHVEPAKKSVQRIRDEVKRLTAGRRTPVPLGQVVGEVNQALRGWSGYFHHRNCSAVFARLKWSVEEQVRTHLRKRHGVRHRPTGYRRFPTAHLYRDLGLFKLPTTAPWCSAHALR